MKMLNMLGDFGGRSAFAQRAALYCRWLHAKQNAMDLSMPRVVMQVLCKLSKQPVASAVVFTIFERDVLTCKEVALLNTAKCVCVPTPCVAACKRGGVNVPLVGINYGVDSIYAVQFGHSVPRLVLLTAGRLSHGERKDVWRVLTAFLYAFKARPDVCLQVKVSDDDVLPNVRSVQIQYITDSLSGVDMARWYSQGLAYVSMSQGEGWGLHEHEAMACGKPVVCTARSGMCRVVPARCLYRVDSTKRGGYYVPSFDSLVAQMQEVVADPVVAFGKGRLAADAVSQFSLEDERQTVLDIVKRYA